MRHEYNLPQAYMNNHRMLCRRCHNEETR